MNPRKGNISVLLVTGLTIVSILVVYFWEKYQTKSLPINNNHQAVQEIPTTPLHENSTSNTEISDSSSNPGWKTYSDKIRGISYDIPPKEWEVQAYNVEKIVMDDLLIISKSRYNDPARVVNNVVIREGYDINWQLNLITNDSYTIDEFNQEEYSFQGPSPNCIPTNFGKLENSGPCQISINLLPFKVLNYPVIEKTVVSKNNGKVFYVLLVIGSVGISGDGLAKFFETPKYIVRYSTNPTDGNISETDLNTLETITKSLKKI